MPLQGATAPTRDTQGAASLALGYVLHWAFSPRLPIRNFKNDIIYALMPQKKLTYEQAMQRLETIVQGFEQNTLELDQLTAQLAEAQQLIKMCNDKLQQVETDVKQILNNEQE